MTRILTPLILSIVLFGGYQLFRLSMMGEYIARSQIAAARAETARVRTRVAMYIQYNASMPSSNREVGLPKPEAFANTIIESIRVEKGGVVVLVLKQRPGFPGGKLISFPSFESGDLEWKCITPDFKNIRQCDYVG